MRIATSMTREQYLALVAREEKGRTPISHPESELQRRCVRWYRNAYRDRRLLLVSVPNGARVQRTQARVLKAEGLTAGVSDLLLFAPSGLLCIEMKAPKGRQSDDQKAWQQAVTAAGYRYEIVRTLADFQRIVDAAMQP